MGRKRMEMALVRDEVSRQVTFSKRKNSLFKKANELVTLCAAEVAIVLFSPGGKPFSFGHPDIDSVTQRFLSQESLKPKPMLVDGPKENEVQELNQVLTNLLKQLEIEKQRGEELDQALKAKLAKSKYKNPINDDVDQDNLFDVKAALQKLGANVKGRISEIKAPSASESDN